MIASVVIPTTGDRAALLAHSVGSVLAQTVADLEVLVIGDGAGRSTQAWAEAADPRVRFFPFPKDVRRGEVNRHRVITEEAQGDIVLYLCDRDLWLPNHVEEMQRVLADADFGHTLRFRMDEDDQPRVPPNLDLRRPVDRTRARSRYTGNGVALSIAGHTLAAYRRLPHGWRQTPPSRVTDQYMWDQFLDQPDIRVAASAWPTVLSFWRPAGWTVAQRLAVLERWSPRLSDPGLTDELVGAVLEEMTVQGADLFRLQQSTVRRWAQRSLPPPVYTRAGRTVRWVRRQLRPG